MHGCVHAAMQHGSMRQSSTGAQDEGMSGAMRRMHKAKPPAPAANPQ
jgi:hypothetical protein